MLERFLLRLYIVAHHWAALISEKLRSKRASWDIPDDIIKEIARCLLPDIVSYCESEAGKADFERWKEQQDEMQKSKAG